MHVLYITIVEVLYLEYILNLMQPISEILLTVCCVIVLEIMNEQTNERLLSIYIN